MKVNPILLEVFKNRFSSIAEEMGVTLTRTAFSPNIKERRDSSCAIFNREGEMVEQAAHIPVHLGSMPLSVQSAIEAVKFQDGDMVILNDPYKGGTHLPDITIVAPVFSNGKAPVFYVANRAHHADVGGMSSGSMPLSTSIFQEGIIIPPIKICEGGKIDDKMMRFLLNNAHRYTQLVILNVFAHAKARSRSARMSSMCSMPMDRRMRSGVSPLAFWLSSDS